MQSAFRLAAVALITVLGLAVALSSRAYSETQRASANTPKFEYEVATIKPTNPNGANGVLSGMNYPDDGFTAVGMTLRFLMQEAFGVQSYQLSGGAPWLNSEKFDVDAKMDGSVVEALSKLGPAEQYSARRQMLLAILVDRLQLKFHREQEELPVLSLTIAKGGPKLQETKPVDPNAPVSTGRPGLHTSTFPGSVSAKGQAVPLADLAQMLSDRLGRIVVDKTGLIGKYDFTLQWATDDAQMQAPGVTRAGTPPTFPEEPASPVLSVALQQLGLKLESGKGPVEVIVIDHIERPSGN